MDELNRVFDAIPGLGGVDPAALGGWLYAALGAMIFAENGLLVAGVLPSSSLVVAAGALAADGVLLLPLLVPIFVVASTLGDLVCYGFGAVAGRRLLARPGRWFGSGALQQAVALFERRGAATLLVSRFLPVLRTLAPVLAGTSRMPLRRFLAFSIAGKVLWTGSLLAVGFGIGSIPGVEVGVAEVVMIVVGAALLMGAVEGVRRLVARRAVPRRGEALQGGAP